MDTSPSDPPSTGAALARAADSTLTEQLADRYAERIRQRLLAPGARLPSVRECARRHGISAYTVVAAYERLLARGLIEARRQRGYFVREAVNTRPAALDPVAAASEPRQKAPLPINATMLIRGMFQPPGSQPMPGLGMLPVEWLDLPMLTRALRQVSAGTRLGPLSLRYGDPAGEPRLRAVLAPWLAEHGVHALPGQIVTTIGATHALDVVTRALTHAGDAVLVDDPGWSVEYARLRALGLELLPVPRGEHGPDLDTLERLMATHRPRLYVTVSVLHNPTGASLSLGHAHRVLRLAQQHGVLIVEDDTYAHLAPPHLPRLAALDGLEHTVYVSGFSKILAPNWRVGFLAAPAALVDRFVDAKLLSTLTTPGLTEQALALCLEEGLLRRHAERVRQKLDVARAASVARAEAAGCRLAAPPRGLFGWVDTGVDTERLARVMLEEGWLLAPGSLFQASPMRSTLMRVNFATTPHARFWEALKVAREGM